MAIRVSQDVHEAAILLQILIGVFNQEIERKYAIANMSK